MRRDVGAFLDGELDPVDAAAVAAHLDDCWGCNEDAETLHLIKASLRRFAARRPTDLALARLRVWADRLIT